jgi:hypothetical protein
MLSYSASNLKRAAGMAGDNEMANPTKLASCFLLQYLLCEAQNYAKANAAARNFITFSRGAINYRDLRSTRRPKWSNYASGVKRDFLKLMVRPKHYKIVTNNLTYLFVN